MNKNDFYKQLMSEYSFDEEKIGSNAKKGRFARSKISPMTIGLTAAVAATTVVCGTLAMTMMGGKGGVDLVGSGSTLSNLTAEQRVLDAMEKQKEEQNNEEIVDVLVTFNAPVSPKSAERILSSYTEENIPVTAVYLADGTKITGTKQVAAVFSGSDEISAVCVKCAGSVMSKIQADSSVFLVELMSESDLNTLVPINPEDVETIEVPAPDNGNTEPENGGFTAPETSTATGGNEEDPIVIGTEESESEDNTDTTEAGGETAVPTEETAESTESAETESASDETVPEAPSVETAEQPTEESAEVPEAPEVTVPTLPAGVQLPENPDSFHYSSRYIGAESAFFLRNNIMYVKTEDAVALYSYEGGTESLLVSEPCLDAKVHWVAEGGGKLIVSGVDENGIRNRLLLVNADAYQIYDLQAEDIVMSGNLTSVGYNAESKTLILDIKEDGIYYVCATKLVDYNGDTDYIGTVFESAAKTSLVAAKGNHVYVAVADGALTQIYAVDIVSGSTRILKTYDNSPRISKNLAFTHGVIAPSSSAVTGNIEIFDPAGESFIKTSYFDEAVTFGASKHNFSVNSGIYTINGGAIAAEGGINAMAAIEYKKSFSTLYAATVDNGYIDIARSIYSDKNRAGVISFSDVNSAGSEEFIGTIEGAIGINNVLALRLCSPSGIYSAEKLSECMNVYYTDSAAAKLRALCGLAESGLLEYDAAVLSSIKASNTELVITNQNDTEASGTLYIKAGSFGGRSAYREVSVSFAFEDGVWKLDTVID